MIDNTTSSHSIANTTVSRSQFKPIFFSSEMVKAILQGRKTQTRRIIKTDTRNIQWQPIVLNGYGGFCDEDGNPVKCKYHIQDIRWVRETFYAYGRWIKNGKTKKSKQKYKFTDFTLLRDNDFHYKYEDCKPRRIKTGRTNESGWHKRPSLFMPKKACRLFIQIEDITVEKLNSISEKDEINEGINPELAGDDLYENYDKVGYRWIRAKDSFKSLWQKINGNWNDNPFVWVITFKVAECPKSGFNVLTQQLNN